MENKTLTAAERSARIFGCTVEQAKNLFARNAATLDDMRIKADKTGRKVNGYSAAELRIMTVDAAERAAGTI